VPVNMVMAGIILGNMYGWVAILCYVVMAMLLALQFYSNKYLANLQYSNCAVTDKRIALISNVIRGIKQVKMRL
jgi:ABC-type bacteriocin/lantibiotic exporter with double-glycine peptidase domain